VRIKNRVKDLASCDGSRQHLDQTSQGSFTSLVVRKSRKSLRESAFVTFHDSRGEVANFRANRRRTHVGDRCIVFR
jgi:hypothetical protein